jgi:hypothetical protein
MRRSLTAWRSKARGQHDGTNAQFYEGSDSMENDFPTREDIAKKTSLWSRDRGLPEETIAFDDRTYDVASPNDAILQLEDISGIPFVKDVPGIEAYQHRARVRADTGDIFSAATAATPGYEDYCRTHLLLGEPTLIRAAQVGDAMEVAQACQNGEAYQKIAAFTRENKGLTIHPYMAIEDIWELAAQLAHDTETSVRVLGPPPPVLWIANDKSTLDALIRLLLGPRWVVETARGQDSTRVTQALIDMADRHPLVGLKRTRCASATGNKVFSSAHIHDTEFSALEDQVRQFLHRTEWTEGEDVLIVEWVDSDVSPSTQLWIPPMGGGDPHVDGIYEQILDGPEKIFVGSQPSGLSETLHRDMTMASLTIAYSLQQMGYCGRCSFDFIVEDPKGNNPSARFTECNGRWGGTSTPMHLVDRCIDGKRPAYLAQDVMQEDLVDADFAALLSMLGEHAYRADRQEGTFLLYNPGCLSGSGKIDVVAIGSTQEEARRAMNDLLPELWGLDSIGAD